MKKQKNYRKIEKNYTVILAVSLKSVEFPLEAKQIPIGQNRRKGRPSSSKTKLK